MDRFVAGTLVLPLLSVLATASSPVARQLASEVLRQLEKVIASDDKEVRNFCCNCLLLTFADPISVRGRSP